MHPEDPDGQLSAPVVDLAGIRLRRGFSAGGILCLHRRLTYSTQERRVWCEDCKRSVDSFDAFMLLTRGFEAMVRDAQRLQRAAQEAHDAKLHLIAAREVEGIWRGRRAVKCPHCRRGILPEDVTGGGSWCRRDHELQRRADAPKAP